MMALTFGMTSGPVISAGLYPSLGYTYTFFFFSALLILLGAIPICFVPSRVNYGIYAKKMEELKR